MTPADDFERWLNLFPGLDSAADMFSEELGTKRILPRAEKAILRQAQNGLYSGLKAVDMLKYSEAWPPSAEQVLPFLHPLIGPSRWSYAEQSRAVELPLRQGGQQNR